MRIRVLDISNLPSHAVNFECPTLIKFPACRTSHIVIRLDIVAYLGVINGAVPNEAGPNECLPVLDNKGRVTAPPARSSQRSGLPEQNLSLHTRRCILNTNTHSRCVLIAISINSYLDAVHCIQVIIDVG